MKKSHDNKRKVTMKDDHVPIELTAIMHHDKESSDRRQAMNKNANIQTEKIMDKDADIQAELTATTLDNAETNDRRNVTSDDVESNSPHIFDALHPNMNAEETLDQSHATVAMMDSGNLSHNSMTTNRRVVETITEEPNLRTTNIINDIEVDLGPIVGYAEVPLLPLYRACAPLIDILHNLSFYVQMALDETPEQPPDGLTIDESAAIRLYTIEWNTPHRSLYSMLNRTLKKDDREHLRPYFMYMKLFLTGLAKLPCVPQLTVWRGVTKDLSTEFPPGTPVTWWAFSSCTTKLTVLENNMYLGNAGSRTLFSVEVINGRIVRAHSHFVTEDEILLLPGPHMIVQSQFSPATDLHIIHLKQVIPEEVLLEPPFEGISNIFNPLS